MLNTNYCQLVLLIFLSATGVTFAQKTNLRQEFERDARLGWSEVRQQGFSNFAYAINRVEIYDNSPARKIEVNFKWFTQEEFKYFESTPLSDSLSKRKIPFGSRNVKVTNGKEAAILKKLAGKNSNWENILLEKVEGKYKFRPEWLRPDWHQLQPRRVLNTLAFSLSDDPRFAIDSTTTLEFFMLVLSSKKPDIFDEFILRTDKILGRVVSASYNIDVKVKGKRKVKMKGEFKFLADWKWLPLSINSESMFYDNDGMYTFSKKRRFTANYDQKSLRTAKANNSIPVPTSTLFELVPDKELTIKQTFRPLTMKEIADINKFRSLEKFKPK